MSDTSSMRDSGEHEISRERIVYTRYAPGETASLAALARSEEKLRAIVGIAADAIIATDASFRITLFNASAERMFGYAVADIIGQPLDLLLPDCVHEARRTQVARFSQYNADLADATVPHLEGTWARHRSGTTFPAEASISRIQIGGTTHFTAIVRDVTAQHEAELEREILLAREREARASSERAEGRSAFLAKASELLHSSLDYTTTFGTLLQYVVPELATYCVVDVVTNTGDVGRLHVVHADPAKQEIADRLRTFPRNQASYMSRNAIVTGEPELMVHVSRELLEARAEDEEHLAVLRELEPASFMIVPLRSREHVLGAICFARDASRPPYTRDDLTLATELAHRAAAALDNAQLYDRAQRAIHARDDVLGVVSHDLRNPLTVISMCVSSLLTHGFDDEEHGREALRTVQQSAYWAQRLIQDLLDISTIEAGGLSLRLEVEDPVVLVTRAAVMFEEVALERGVTLDTDIPESLPPILCDADRILQVLGNLIANAIKFTGAGGHVVLGAVHEENGIRLFVDDDGVGIPPEDVPHIFDRFWTARRSSRVRGTGMGLAIVRGIVDAHGGRVWVERGSRGGTMFSVLLPLAPASSG